MTTENDTRAKKWISISLNAAETTALKRPQTGEKIEIIVKSGVIRIAANQSQNAENLTLAFVCKADEFKFHYPDSLEITIEAITNTTYFVKTKEETDPVTSDAILEWVIQLHIVRLETNLECRLMKFFKLMMMRLGKRTPEGLLLEHTLSHARIAEIVGSTRSTVSRTIGNLRKNRKIYIDELKSQIILPVD